MDVQQTIAGLKKELMAGATKERAQFEKNYLKSDLVFFGATVPATTTAAKGLWKRIKPSTRGAVLQLCDALWSEGVHELRGVALGVLACAPDFVTKTDLPKLKRWVIESNGWAHVDTIGAHVLGNLVSRDVSTLAVMDKWAVDKHFWVRRAAMLSLLLHLRSGELAEWPRFVRYASPQLEEKEFFIRKVIGWILRETSKKNPAVVFDFLLANRERVSGLTLREGAKYLPPAMRKKLGL